MSDHEIQKSEEEWRDQLTPEQYDVLREKGTEAPFSGEYVNEKTPGMYTCAACGNEIFSSKTKFDSNSGWPSFYDVLEEGRVVLQSDDSLGMERTEVVCAKCGSHLGHVFDDGPTQTQEGEPATGKRYCINSVALNLKEDESEES